jgi:cell division protein ZapA (FtsZ GTPase activity inhibitor)
MIAVLTAINVADEYLKNADEFKNLKEQMNANSNNLSEATVKIEEYKKENDELKTVIQNLKMSLVKKETELEEFTVRRRPNNSNNMVDFDAGKNKRNIK